MLPTSTEKRDPVLLNALFAVAILAIGVATCWALLREPRKDEEENKSPQARPVHTSYSLLDDLPSKKAPESSTFLLNRSGEVEHRLIIASDVKSDVNTADVKKQAIRSIKAVEDALSPFDKSIQITVQEKVERPGQALKSGMHWTGNFTKEAKGGQVQIAAAELGDDKELRFYVARARLDELKASGPAACITLGLAHSLRTDDGFDAGSNQLLNRVTPLALDGDLRSELMISNADYRDRARATSWALVYYLRAVKKQTPKEILEIAPAALPDVRQKLDEIKTAVRERKK